VPDPFRLVPTKTFLIDLPRIPSSLRRRTEAAIQELNKDSFRGRKLEAVKTGQWRIRIGDYRVRYDVVGDDVAWHRIRHRKAIYLK
jgi:mRNA-degrading endonuclease RelE of RelBE toxin-antitoxin system